MLNKKYIPTRLIDPADRPPLAIVETRDPARFRRLFVLAKSFRWLAGTLWLGLMGKLNREQYAYRFRRFIEEIGGLWIKVGQLLSFRVDIFSIEFCRELSKLQDSAVGFPSEVAKKIIEEELGAPIEHFFDHFEDMPFAAASIGQIHKAHLRREGVWVAVKIRRPHLENVFARDLGIVEWIVRFLRILSIRSFMRWQEGLQELRRIVEEELDCRYEASAFRRMKRLLRRHNIYVPKVFLPYNTKRVVVTEFIAAALMADYIRMSNTDPVRLATWLQENNINPRSVARQLIRSIFRQVLEDNLYHSDLHPGNIILLRDSRIALIDFGAISFTDLEYLRRFRLFFNAMVTRDYSKAAELALLLGGAVPVTDIVMVQGKLVEVLSAWGTRTLVKDLPYHEKSLDNAFIQLAKIMSRYRCEVNWQMLKMRRATATLDASIVCLFPEIDLTRRLQAYLRKAELRHVKEAVRNRMLPRLIKGMTTLMDVMETAYEQGLYQGSLIRRQAQVFERTTNKFAYLFAFLLGQVAVAGVLVGILFFTAYFYQHHPDWIKAWVGDRLSPLARIFPILDERVWIGLLVMDIYLVWASVKLRRQFLEKDIRSRD